MASTLRELLRLEDGPFVDAAYRFVLNRAADASGRANYVRHLREGMSKVEVIDALMRSDEGREKGASVKGLRWRRLVNRLAGVGAMRAILVGDGSTLRLPPASIERRWLIPLMIRLDEERQAQRAQMDAQAQVLADLAAAIRRVADATDARVAAISSSSLESGGAVFRANFERALEGVLGDARIQAQLLAAVQSATAACRPGAPSPGTGLGTSEGGAAPEVLRDIRKSQDDLSAAVLQLQLEAATMRSQFSTLATELPKLRATIGGLEQHVQGFGVSLEECAGAISMLEGVAVRAPEFEQLQSRVDDWKAILSQLMGAVGPVLAAGGRLEADAERHARRLASLAQDLAMARRRLRKLGAASRAERAETAARLALLAEAVGEVRQSVAGVIEAGAPATERIDRDIAELRREIESARESLALSRPGRYPLTTHALGDGHRADVEAVEDARYADFEEHFRGSREDIARRLTAYRSYLETVSRAHGGGIAIDVGCGRGEFLDLLRDVGLTGIGVDQNAVFVEGCRTRGLTAEKGDAVDYLEAIPAATVSVISAIHVAEHLGYERLARLVTASARALRPGGCLILETPNPANVKVGACNFYIDPTHQRPLPPVLLQHLLRGAGFVNVEAIDLQYGPEIEGIASLPSDVAALLRETLLRGEDYAAIGLRP